MDPSLETLCNRLRVAAEIHGDETKQLMEHGDFSREQSYQGQHGEMRANIMLAYRHLEDARMRIGKVLQAASDDGVSILDK